MRPRKQVTVTNADPGRAARGAARRPNIGPPVAAGILGRHRARKARREGRAFLRSTTVQWLTPRDTSSRCSARRMRFPGRNCGAVYIPLLRGRSLRLPISWAASAFQAGLVMTPLQMFCDVAMAHGQLVLRSYAKSSSFVANFADQLTWTSLRCFRGLELRSACLEGNAEPGQRIQLQAASKPRPVQFGFGARCPGRNGAEPRWHGTYKTRIGVNHGHKSNWLNRRSARSSRTLAGDAEVVVVSEQPDNHSLSFASLNPRHQYHRVPRVKSFEPPLAKALGTTEWASDNSGPQRSRKERMGIQQTISFIRMVLARSLRSRRSENHRITT